MPEVEQRRSSCRTRARFRRYMEVPSKTPAPPHGPGGHGCPEGASAGCPFSWLLLFGQALRRRSGANAEGGPEGAEGRMPGVKRSDSAPAEGDETSRQRNKRRGKPHAVAKEHTHT